MLIWNTILKHSFFISILLISVKENSQSKISQVDKHGKTFKQLGKDNKQETLLNIQQNFQTVTTQRLEEKIQKLQKQLSDLKLSNKNMKTQLTRVNILKVSKGRETFKNSLSFVLLLFLLYVSIELYFTPIKNNIYIIKHIE